jgi:cytochrome c554/c'-like protein
MGRIGYAAVNVGEREVLFGPEKIREWAKQNNLPLLSANLVYQDSAQPAFTPSLVKTIEIGNAGGGKRKLRIGVVGIARMNAGLSVPTADGRRIVTSDPITALRGQLTALARKIDFAVVLTSADPDQSRDILKQVQGVGLLLGGSGPLVLNEDVSSAATAVPSGAATLPPKLVYAGNQGKKVGEIRLFLSQDGLVAKLDPETINLGKMVPDDPAIMDLVDQNRIAINEIHKREAPLVDSEKLRAMYQGASFVRSEACKTCHEEAYKVWESSKHAHAFKTLEERHQDYNPDCVGCHTTGFRKPTGFLNAKSTPDLMNVQCESCHGPGIGHPDKLGKGYGTVAKDFCVTCHTPENSPDFDALAYRVKIRHWEENAASSAASVSSH